LYLYRFLAILTLKCGQPVGELKFFVVKEWYLVIAWKGKVAGRDSGKLVVFGQSGIVCFMQSWP
jgi:hypothetical protein